MGENSKIEWTDHTFNPWIGCTKVAAGCEHCYAEASMDQRLGRAKWGPGGTRVKTSAANWQKPLKWNREAEAAGVRKKVFCASLADVFEDWEGWVLNHHGEVLQHCRDCGKIAAPGTLPACPPHCGVCESGGVRLVTLDDLRRDLFALIDATPWLDWLLVTKRPENVRRMWPEEVDGRGSRVESQNPRASRLAPRGFRPNVWLLTSIATQDDANKNIPELLKCRDLVPVLGVSAEPLRGPVRLDHMDLDATSEWCQINALNGMHTDMGRPCTDVPKLDWVIVGGESGHEARPCHPDWVRAIRDQCQAAGVPFHFKQWGELLPRCQAGDGQAGAMPKCNPVFFPSPHNPAKENTYYRVGKAKAGRLLDGREWSEFPEAAEG